MKDEKTRQEIISFMNQIVDENILLRREVNRLSKEVDRLIEKLYIKIVKDRIEESGK